MSDDRHEGLSPAGPAEDELGAPVATPPWTDGHADSEGAGFQVLYLATKALYVPSISAATYCCQLQLATTSAV